MQQLVNNIRAFTRAIRSSFFASSYFLWLLKSLPLVALYKPKKLSFQLQKAATAIPNAALTSLQILVLNYLMLKQITHGVI